HQYQIGTVFAGKLERLDSITRRNGMIAVGLQQIAKQLHVELVVLHDHYGLRHVARLNDSSSLSTNIEYIVAPPRTVGCDFAAGCYHVTPARPGRCPLSDG